MCLLIFQQPPPHSDAVQTTGRSLCCHPGHSRRHPPDGTSVGLFVSAAEYEPPCLLFNKQQDCVAAAAAPQRSLIRGTRSSYFEFLLDPSRLRSARRCVRQPESRRLRSGLEEIKRASEKRSVLYEATEEEGEGEGPTCFLF